MISAGDALRTSRAQLTDDQKTRAALLAIEVEEFIKARVEHCGCQDFRTTEQDGNVVASVNQLLRANGWLTSWTPTYGKSEKGRQALTGWRLDLTPNDAAYAAVRERGTN